MHTHNSGVHKHDLKSWKIHCLRSISTAAFFQPYRQVTESPQEFFPHHFSATALVKVTSYIHVAKPIDYYSVFISMNNSKTSGRVNHSLPVFSNIASLHSHLKGLNCISASLMQINYSFLKGALFLFCTSSSSSVPLTARNLVKTPFENLD